MVQALNKLKMEAAFTQNAALQKQLKDMAKTQKESLDKLNEQNKSTNNLLEKEREKNDKLKSKNFSLIIVAINAAIIEIA